MRWGCCGGARSPIPVDAACPQSPSVQFLFLLTHDLSFWLQHPAVKRRSQWMFFCFCFGVRDGGKTPLQILFLFLGFQSPGTFRKSASFFSWCNSRPRASEPGGPGRGGRGGSAAGPDCCASRQRSQARPRAWAAELRSTTNSSCACPPTWSGTPPASSAPSAASTWTRRALAS